MSKQNVVERIKSNKKRGRTYCNTRVQPWRDDNGHNMIDILLFHNQISRFDLTRGTFSVSDGGCQSNTSRDWMRELMRAFADDGDRDERGLYIRKGIWYSKPPMIYIGGTGRKKYKFDEDTPKWKEQKFQIREGIFPEHDEVRKRLPEVLAEHVLSFL